MASMTGSGARRRILLLNPPFASTVIRDNYCSYTSKADYCWAPIDLLVQSGILSRRHEVQVLDCNVLGLSTAACLARLRRLSFDAVLSMTGLVSWSDDLALLATLAAERPDLDIFVTGDLILRDAERVLERYPFLSGALTNYSSDDLELWLNGERHGFQQLAWRDGERVVPALKSGHPRVIAYPVPHHELFPLSRYRISIGREARFATVVASMGCNFRCPFCLASAMPLALRDTDNLLEELRYLRRRGISEIYFYDPNFTAKRGRVRELCDRLVDEGLHLRWMANGQVANLDEETIAAMAQAGCHTVMLGLETADDQLIRRNRKGFTRQQAERTVNLLKKHGIRVFAYFVFGLPGATLASMRQTIDYAVSLRLDFASFNLFTPLVGTPLWQELSPPDYLDPSSGYSMNRSVAPIGASAEVPTEVLIRLKREAYRRFYLRPDYVARRLLDMESFGHARRALKSAVALAINQIF